MGRRNLHDPPAAAGVCRQSFSAFHCAWLRIMREIQSLGEFVSNAGVPGYLSGPAAAFAKQRFSRFAFQADRACGTMQQIFKESSCSGLSVY